MSLGNYFILEYPIHTFEKIVYNKPLTFPWKTKSFEKLDKTKMIIKKKQDIHRYEQLQLKESQLFLFDLTPFYQGLFRMLKQNHLYLRINHLMTQKNFIKNKPCCIINEYYYDTQKSINITKKNTNKKFKLISSVWVSPEVYYQQIGSKGYCGNLDILYFSYLSVIEKLYERLESGGNFFFAIYFQPCQKKYVEIIYLLSLFFHKVIIMNGNTFYCLGYRGNDILSQQEFKKIKESKTFQIYPKIEFKALSSYYQFILQNEYQKINYIIKEDIHPLVEIYLKKGIQDILFFDFQSKYFPYLLSRLESSYDIKITNDKIYSHLEKIYKKQINTLHQIVSKQLQKHKKTKQHIFQLGMGYGIFTSVFIKILQKMKSCDLLVSDLEQKDVWENAGIQYIQNMKKSNYKITYEDPITLLPNLLKEHSDSYFDIIFIQKSYAFDRMIGYLQFINLLLKENGLLIILKVVNETDLAIHDYMKSNYSFMKYIPNPYFYIFQKLDIDKRLITDFTKI
jgi:hypothetical protein